MSLLESIKNLKYLLHMIVGGTLKIERKVGVIPHSGAEAQIYRFRPFGDNTWTHTTSYQDYGDYKDSKEQKIKFSFHIYLLQCDFLLYIIIYQPIKKVKPWWPKNKIA